MLTLQEREDLERELRRELIVLLHVNEGEWATLPDIDFPGAMEVLREVRGSLIGISAKHAALKVSVPPLLPAARLRKVLGAGLRRALGRRVAVSLRIVPELADTVETAGELMEESAESGVGVLCFTDESAVGELAMSLAELKTYLSEKVGNDLLSAFPMTHYDVLCVMRESMTRILSDPEKVVSEVYAELSKVAVGSTARPLDSARELMETFHR